MTDPEPDWLLYDRYVYDLSDQRGIRPEHVDKDEPMNHVSPLSLNLEADPRFTAWNHFHDHDFCQCSTGDYKAKAGYIRYYFRCPGNIPTSKTCRQLVYGSDDILRAGFGNAEQIEL